MLWIARGYGWYEWLWLWVKSSICYEQLKDMNDTNNSMLWALGSRCYDKLKVVDDMNDSRSRELKPLDDMNNLGLQVI